jgi:hypothetical protein
MSVEERRTFETCVLVALWKLWETYRHYAVVLSYLLLIRKYVRNCQWISLLLGYANVFIAPSLLLRFCGRYWWWRLRSTRCLKRFFEVDNKTFTYLYIYLQKYWTQHFALNVTTVSRRHKSSYQPRPKITIFLIVACCRLATTWHLYGDFRYDMVISSGRSIQNSEFA